MSSSSRCTYTAEHLEKEGKVLCVPEGQHLGRNCQSKLRCKDCGGRHHVRRSQPAGQKHHSPHSYNPVMLQIVSKGKGLHVGRGRHASILYADAKTSVLLQTAHALLSGTGHDEKAVKARVILDSCSQRSYVSCRLKESLNLTVIRTEKLMIKTFGSDEGQMQSCEVVQLCLKEVSTDLNFYLTAYVVPMICAPLQNQAIEVAYHYYPHLTGLKLADDTAENPALEMDILVGSDSY